MLTGCDKFSKTRTIQNLDSNMIERKIQELIFVAAEDVFSKGFFQLKFQGNIKKYFTHVLKELQTLVDQLFISYKMTSLLEQLKTMQGDIEAKEQLSHVKDNIMISKF